MVLGLWVCTKQVRWKQSCRGVCVRWSAERRFEDWQKKKLPSQEKLIKGKTIELRLAQRKCIGSGLLGRRNWRTLNVCHKCIDWEINLPWKAYCSLGTDYSDRASSGTDTVSYGSSGKKGLPGLCNVLPPASSFGVPLLYCNQDCSQCIVSYTVQPLSAKLPQALCWSAIVFSVTKAVISLLPNTNLMPFVTGLRYFVSQGNYSD